MGQEHIILISLIVIFTVVEYFFSRSKTSFINKHKVEDSVWLLLNEFLYPVALGFISFKVGSWFESYLSDLNLVWNLSHYHYALQFIAFMLVIDFISFLFHYYAHKYYTLWEFHKVHHAVSELNFLSSFRSSWSYNISQGFIFGLFTSWILIDERVRGMGNIAFIAICMFQHLNIKFRFPGILEKIIISPKNHYWHHTKMKAYPFGQNFGLIFTWWDHLWGTYYNPDHYESEIGLSEEFEYTSFFSKIIYPLDQWGKKLIRMITPK